MAEKSLKDTTASPMQKTILQFSSLTLSPSKRSTGMQGREKSPEPPIAEDEEREDSLEEEAQDSPPSPLDDREQFGELENPEIDDSARAVEGDSTVGAGREDGSYYTPPYATGKETLVYPARDEERAIVTGTLPRRALKLPLSEEPVVRSRPTHPIRTRDRLEDFCESTDARFAGVSNEMEAIRLHLMKLSKGMDMMLERTKVLPTSPPPNVPGPAAKSAWDFRSVPTPHTLGAPTTPQWAPLPPPTMRELRVNFDGDPKKLSLFLNHVRCYMEEFEFTFPNEASKVRYISSQLTGEAGDWLNEMHNGGAPELRSFARFMTALQERFQDPGARLRARDSLRNFSQGTQTVAEYSAKFRSMAQLVEGWPDAFIMDLYQNGLNPDISDWCMFLPTPTTLTEWVELATQAEITQARSAERHLKHKRTLAETSTREGGKGQQKGAERARSFNERREQRMREGRCLRCGDLGHRIANCPRGTRPSMAKAPAEKQRKTHPPPPPKPKRTVKESMATAIVPYREGNYALSDSSESGSPEPSEN